MRVTFWLLAREVCPAAFEELSAITVPPEIAENWIEYYNERGSAIQRAMHGLAEAPRRAERASAARRDTELARLKQKATGWVAYLRRNAEVVTFEENLAAWAQRHHVPLDWIVELARGSRLAWSAGYREHLDVEPLPRAKERLRLRFRATDGAAGLQTYELVPPRFDPRNDTDDSHQKRVKTYREDVHTLHSEAGWVRAKVPRELERDLRWTVRAVMLGDRWEEIAKKSEPRVEANAVRMAVTSMCADLELPVGRRRSGRPRGRPAG